jgi:uridine kinase
MIIKCENELIEIEEPISIKEGLKVQIEKSDVKDIIAARYNNEVVSLDKEINKDGKIEFINKQNRDGRYIYIRGALYIASKAISELYPKALLTVNYQLTNAMYCQIDNMEVTDEMIEKVKIRMQEIVKQNIPIKKVIMTKEEAEKFYEKEPTLKGRLQTDVNKERISLYYCEDYYNYFYGIMPVSTGAINLVDIEKFRNGYLVKYPSVNKPNELQAESQKSLKQISAMDEYEEIYGLMKMNTVYRLNKKLREGKEKELILLSEAIHEKKIAEIAQKIKERQDVRMVLIAGPSSSGKTTFANKLGMALRVQGIKPVTLSTDNYFVERKDNPKDSEGNYDFECIEAIDTKLFNQQLIDLLAGKEVNLPTFDFIEGSKRYLGNKMKLEEDEILVIEGIHCLNDKLTSLIPKENKFKIYISDLTVLNIDYYNRISTTDTRLIRRMVRDYNFRGYSALHTLKMWKSVNRGEQKNIFPYQEEADCMFNSSIVYELSALKKYALPLLEEITDDNPEYSEARRLISMLQYFDTVEPDWIPNNSLLREFIGGSIYDV